MLFPMQTAVRMEPSDIQWSEMKMDERSPAGETTVRNDTKIVATKITKACCKLLSYVL